MNRALDPAALAEGSASIARRPDSVVPFGVSSRREAV
jgi:hypothetical protein